MIQLEKLHRYFPNICKKKDELLEIKSKLESFLPPGVVLKRIISQNNKNNQHGFHLIDTKKNRQIGMTLFSPFDKDAYPPPLTSDGRLDNADPVFFLEEQDVTDKIYRGYVLQKLSAKNDHFAVILLMNVLCDIRSYHGRSLVVLGEKIGSLQFGFRRLRCRFSPRHGGGSWLTQETQHTPVVKPTFYGRIVESSKLMITLETIPNK